MAGYKYINGRYAHRVIYERHHGSIPAGFVIHHKDEDKSNNAIENLEAMPKSEHQRHHATGKENSVAQRQAAAKTLESLRIPKDAECLHCKESFVSLSANRAGKFCSRSCLEQWRCNKFIPEPRKCLVCQKDYTAVKRFQMYCCKRCNAKSTTRTYRVEPTGGTKRRTVAELTDVQPNG